MKKEIWLGSLHYGSLIKFETSSVILKNLLENKYDVNIDLSYLYASGESLKEVGKLCKEFKDIKVSVKYGLEKKINSKGNWAVKISNGGKKSLEMSLRNYLEFIPEENINSFQIHAFNKEKIEIWLKAAKSFNLFKNYGCSNMNTEELSKVKKIASDNLINISFAQIHANLLERRILEEYKKAKLIKSIIVNRSLARGFLSDRNVKGIQKEDSRTIKSSRVKNSLPKEIKFIIPEIMNIISNYNYSLSTLGYFWLMNQSKEDFQVKPIISPRSLEDLLDYFNAESISENIFYKILEKIEPKLKTINSLMYQYPLFDLEK